MTKSEQARADALADAETLRLAAVMSEDDGYAYMRISKARQWIDKALVQSWPSSTRKYASRAARAAFRAVPGLREVSS